MLTRGEELLTPQEVADALRVHVRTFYQWCRHGMGPTPTRLGERDRYARRDVEAWLLNRRASEERIRSAS
jgi:excisionase family DNA binding protein